jgi:response regulator NasT
MESALIISGREKSAAMFAEILASASITPLAVLQTCGEAKRLLLERDFDLVVVDAPLRDESGESLSRYIAARGASQVILAVKNEYFAAVCAACESDGVLTVSKPMNRDIFWSALTLAKSTHGRIRRIQDENAKLKQKIDDIRIVDRAKWILVSHMNMHEKEAHRYIEKQAMDLRTTKRKIAEGILKTYEN